MLKVGPFFFSGWRSCIVIRPETAVAGSEHYLFTPHQTKDWGELKKLNPNRSHALQRLL
jgi:hypothetical protein